MLVPPTRPGVEAIGVDATASIGVTLIIPPSTVPAGDWDVSFAEMKRDFPTYAARKAALATYGDVAAYVPTAPPTTTVDVWRRVEADGGSGVRIASGADPSVVFTDWTPASGVEYQYRATAHAAINGTSTEGLWPGDAVGALYPSSSLYPSPSLFPSPA